MKRTYGVVHGMARCLDCGWTTESYKNAQALAARHAMHYGHRIEGEIASSYSYFGESSERSKRAAALGAEDQVGVRK